MRHLFLLLLLGGCVVLMTPSEIREHGVKAEFQTSKSAVDAADCIAKVIEEYRPFLDVSFLARVRQIGQGTIEVDGAYFNAVRVIVQVQPSATGSTVTVWRSPQMVWSLENVIAKSGC